MCDYETFLYTIATVIRVIDQPVIVDRISPKIGHRWISNNRREKYEVLNPSIIHHLGEIPLKKLLPSAFNPVAVMFFESKRDFTHQKIFPGWCAG